jgi:hypothetical protein
LAKNADGQGSDDISTLNAYTEEIPSCINKLILLSDSCDRQNKNSNMICYSVIWSKTNSVLNKWNMNFQHRSLVLEFRDSAVI